MRLNERLKALEVNQTPDLISTIILRLVAPGFVENEIHHISDKAGNEWRRKPEETESAFTDRATREATPNQWSMKVLIGKTMEAPHVSK